MESSAEAVLATWFGPLDAPDYPAPRPKLWWGKDAEVDAELGEQFGAFLDRAGRGELEHWTSDPRGHLALVILIDQLSRNIHRDSARMYALDDEAVDLVLRGLEEGVDQALEPRERVFFYMPLMHAENVALQRACVRCFQRLVDDPSIDGEAREGFVGNLDFARRHLEIVERFGRFPHRNAILGRASTEEERAFLETPGSSF